MLVRVLVQPQRLVGILLEPEEPELFRLRFPPDLPKEPNRTVKRVKRNTLNIAILA